VLRDNVGAWSVGRPAYVAHRVISLRRGIWSLPGHSRHWSSPQQTCSIYEYAPQLATSRRKIDVSGIEVNGLRQDKTRRGERRACVD